jgi:hypothetical protein
MVHMLQCRLAAHKIMQVLTIFVDPNQNPSQHNIQVAKLDSRGVALTYQDTSAPLVTQAYGCSTHEALGPVAAS